jgi:hypothetical protein
MGFNKRYQTLRNKTVGTFRELPRDVAIHALFSRHKKSGAQCAAFLVCG